MCIVFVVTVAFSFIHRESNLVSVFPVYRRSTLQGIRYYIFLAGKTENSGLILMQRREICFPAVYNLHHGILMKVESR